MFAFMSAKFQLIPVFSNSPFSTCSAVMDSKHFSFVVNAVLKLVSRRCWRDIAWVREILSGCGFCFLLFLRYTGSVHCMCVSVHTEVLCSSQVPQSMKSLGVLQASPWFCQCRHWHRPCANRQKHPALCAPAISFGLLVLARIVSCWPAVMDKSLWTSLPSVSCSHILVSDISTVVWGRHPSSKCVLSWVPSLTLGCSLEFSLSLYSSIIN